MDDFIDLHVHSYYSDGMSSPTENIKLAKTIGLKAITLSDHDTIKGVAEAQTAAKEAGIEFVPGIEVSTFDDDCHSMHMLGLLWQDEKPLLKIEPLSGASRDARNVDICNRLRKEFGFDTSLEDLKACSHSTITGTGHLCRVLVNKGYSSDFNEAMAKIRVVKEKIPYGIRIEDAIEYVHMSKGLAILAHPVLLKMNDDDLFFKIKKLKDNYGLDGIECFHTKHSDDMISLYLSFAKKLDMVISGGSDYHAEFRPDIALGKGRHDDFFVPYSCLDKMKEYYSSIY